MENNNKFINNNYLKYVDNVCPKTDQSKTLIRAFWVGGFICCIGQAFRILLEKIGLSGDELSGFVSIILIFLGSLLTGIGIYDRIGKYAGGGSIVPITGFANSIVSPSMEFKTEGYIYGLASKMFVIAGPIIVYGTISSVIVGLIYYFLYGVNLL